MRRFFYSILVVLQVVLVLFSSSIDIIDQPDTGKSFSVFSKKGDLVSFIESDLTDSEPLFFAPARERDSRPVEFIANSPSYYPWTPSVFFSGNILFREETWSKLFVSFLLTNLPPPTVS
ncbi:hypothetical protein [Leptospira fainei]|uniref:hypothetical protein n=1 Tax=Leptospira fainei TaxID=48782 RepID=UPI0012EB97F5|nr:hypothetical protein [Leptospira fainei]